jgi:uncharacterized membrane protein YeaQ/YmgE (transglycosylase-associated protein family)
LKFGAKISAEIKMLKAECVTSYRTFQGLYLEFCANVCQRSNAQQGLMLNIIVGIVGALVARFLLTPLFGIATINQSNFSLPSLLVSLLGAIILLAIVNLFRRGTVR